MLVEETPSPIAYVTEWTFIGLYSVWLLFGKFLSSKLSSINNFFQMMNTVLSRLSKFEIIAVSIPSSSSSYIITSLTL